MPLKSQISNLKLVLPVRERSAVCSVLVRAWWYLRQITGDAAYENYLRRAPFNGHASCPTLSREEFYLDALRRRYTGVSRCC